MKKFLFAVFLLMLCIACNAQQKEYTLEELKTEYKDVFDIYDIPIGTRFWDEFGNFESQYRLTSDESKLLGKWMNITYLENLVNNYYVFFPNKFFLLTLNQGNIRLTDAKEVYFNKALGTWEIVDDIVRITIYAFITEDAKLSYSDNKGLFFVEKPYTVDFIKIKDIDEWGFTKRPVNDKVLSKELQRKVVVRGKNKTNNLYVRNVYMINLALDVKNYGYFRIMPEIAKNNISGLDLATNPELIKKHILNL